MNRIQESFLCYAEVQEKCTCGKSIYDLGVVDRSSNKYGDDIVSNSGHCSQTIHALPTFQTRS